MPACQGRSQSGLASKGLAFKAVGEEQEPGQAAQPLADEQKDDGQGDVFHGR